MSYSHIHNTRYQVIFIDWDGTLSNSRFWHRWAGTERYELIQQVLFTEARDLLNDWMTGMVSSATVLKYVEDRTGIIYDELHKELQYSSEHMEFIDQRVIRLINELRNEGMKVVIATDNMDTFRRWTVPSLQLEHLVDGILVSDTQGALKSQVHPDGTSKFFHHYLSQNGFKSQDSVLIDNSLDAKVVKKFGMNFLHVNESSSLCDHLEKILADATLMSLDI